MTLSETQSRFQLSEQGVLQVNGPDDHFQKKSFDLIVAISIFEHIEDLEPIINRINTLLTPQGQLFAGMPSVDPLLSWKKLSVYWT